MNVLIVDDAEDSCLLLQTFLKRKNCVTNTASTGTIALKLWRESTYDLVLLDMTLPDMKGEEVAKTIRKEEKDTKRASCKIVAITGKTLQEDIDSALKSGCDSYLAKPISIKVLFAAMDELLPYKKTA